MKLRVMGGFSCKQLGAKVTNFAVSIAALPRLAIKLSDIRVYTDSSIEGRCDAPKLELGMGWEESLMVCRAAEGFFSPSLDEQLEEIFSAKY